MTQKMRQLLSSEPGFGVPEVFPELSSRRVLTTKLVDGVPIDQIAVMDQETRDRVSLRLMRLTMKELFQLNVMQTDPNWSNFLYDAKVVSDCLYVCMYVLCS